MVRHADADFSRGGVSDFSNDFDFTLDTAMNLKAGFKSGLSLTNSTFSFLYEAYTRLTSGGPDPCNPTANLAPQPFVGDGSIDVLYLLTVPKNSTKTFNMTYKPI